ncbi:Haloacid dehalogenase domain protein hydrolase [Carbonactinospora thermoautotrophica]|uniref:Haloacid dehalogenase domain protein hydrolase n=1 Tax=Carbonactinospora thermoautotrophica TaxID=1469144 RepID=A0A132MHH0_9ACTN|nr:HAD-IB family phosphatase [Carbonactinospora thermoautotrophica]KWW97310.1 Haloacid dehalogenase domain protein hydrolase [Carbonactinospora thermoautotrophica]
MTKLHIFDMDGTLLRGTASVEISRRVGQLEAAMAIEEGWVRGEISDVQFWELCLPLWQGITDADIDEAFEAAPWIDGVEAVFADIAQRGEYSAVITQSPQFFAERLLRWGVGSVYGAGVEPGGRAGSDLLLTADDKVVIATKLMADYGLTEADCVAYGDSSSDVPLFRRLRHTVAVNGSETIRKLAAVVYDGCDLREAYAAGRSLLSDGGANGPERDRHRADTCA